jgi:hypothetical protein
VRLLPLSSYSHSLPTPSSRGGSEVGATPKWREARTRERVQGDRDLGDEAKARKKIAEAEETYAPRIANAQREVHENA